MARKSIQGLTIEIGGDTSKLQDSLKGVEKKLRDTQDALRDVGKLLKLDPGNVELLSQKQRLLGEAIQGTEEKLKTLKEAAAQAEQQMADGSMSQAQFDALQREIIDTQQQLDGLNREMKTFGSVAQQQLAAAGQKVSDFGDKVSGAGDKLTKLVTGPLVALGGASAAAWGEVDDGMDTIIKKTGATGAALDDMQARAKHLATTLPTDFATAGTAIGEVNTRFGLTGDALEALSGQFIKFARLNDTDVNSSIDNVQSAMAAWGIEAEGAGSMLDILNKAGQDTGVSMDRLTNDLTSNAAVLQEMGFGIYSATGFLANLNKNGLDAGTVLTGMKKALQNATKEGKPMSQALKELQDSLGGSASRTEALQTATELFGAKAAPALVNALRDGRISFRDLDNAVKDASGSVSQTFAATLDPLDELQSAMNDLKLTGYDLVESAAPMIAQAIGDLKDVITQLREAWEGLSPEQQEMAIQLAGIAAAAGPVLAVGGRLISGVGNLFTLLAANPAAAVIAAMAAVGAALVSLYNNCEEFREGVDAVWQDITQGWDNLVANAQKLGEDWNTFCEGVTSAATEAWNGILTGAEAFGTDFTAFWQGIGNGMSEEWENVKTVAGEKWEGVKGVFIEKLDAITAAYEEHGGGLEGIAAATWQAIQEASTLGLDVLNALTGGKLDDVKQLFIDAWEGAKQTVRDALDAIRGFFDFQWELPKIPLPHFSITGDFSLVPPRAPRFSVDWYAKAMDAGMILTSPTIFPAANGTLRGFGDAGPEAVVGVHSLMDMIAEAVAGAAGETVEVPRVQSPRVMNVILQIGETEIGRTVVPIIEAEQQRYGVRLVKGGVSP